MEKTLTFKNGIKDGLPIGLGYLSVSFAFGVGASALGVPFFISTLISMTNLTSAGQFAGLSIIVALGGILEMLITETVINSRYFLMSIALSQKLDASFTTAKRFFYSAFITDEIFAVAVSKKEDINTNYFRGLIFLPYLLWSLGTFLGAITGDILPTIVISSLGIALYAMFIAIIIPPSIKSVSVLFVVLLSAAISCVFYYVPVLNENVSSGFAVVICTLVSSVVMALLFPVKEEKEKEDAV